MNSIAIIGLSCLFPKSANREEFWSSIRRGVDAISEIPSTHWDVGAYFNQDQKAPDQTYAQRGGFLSPVAFDPLEFGISPNNIEAIDTSQLLGLVGAKRALEDAGYGADRNWDRTRASCILGVTGTLELVIPLGARLGHPRWRQALRDAGVPDDVADDVVARIGESYVPWQENSFPGLLGNVVAGRIANRFDFGGTNCVVDAACASSLSAIHLAVLELTSGRSDLVLTGGVDTFNDIFMYMCFSKTPALSPTGDARPFSETADGTILGEGVGMLVLKRLEDAERDGDRIVAVIKGMGTSSDGAGNAVYAPKAEGQIRCLQDAYRVAGVSPDTIELIEAHGTGTKVGDATEIQGLTQVFSQVATERPRPWCAVGSVKSQIGHTKAAAGVAGLIKSVLGLQYQVLPPTIKVQQPAGAFADPESPFYVNTQARPWLATPDHPRRAGVSAFGFGGSNFHCVVEEYPAVRPSPADAVGFSADPASIHQAGSSETNSLPSLVDAAGGEPIAWDSEVLLLTFSASGLTELCARVAAVETIPGWAQLRELAVESRAAFRATDNYRFAVVLEREKLGADVAAVQKLSRNWVEQLERYADKTQWSTPDGVFFARGACAGKLVALFPGQGSQSTHMLNELACRFPAMRRVLEEANAAFIESRRESSPATSNDASASGRRLSDYIYPLPAFNDTHRQQQQQALRATEIAQPAIGAVSLGALAVLHQFGVSPQIVGGHSYGELTALCASQRFARSALYRLSMLRGQLMAEAQVTAGGMLAVAASAAEVEEALRVANLDLVIANRNGPKQVVLSGRVAELERADAVFAAKNIRGKRLPVGAAFHSPLVAGASARFRPVLEAIDFAAAQIPVYANSSAVEYPADPTAAKELLANQLAQPVQFVEEIENIYAAGGRTFLEIGPGNVLTGLVGSILAGRDVRTIAVDASQGKRTGLFDLAVVLAQLSVAGYPVRLTAWDPADPRRAAEAAPSPRLRIPLSGANYVKPRTPRPPRSTKLTTATVTNSTANPLPTERSAANLPPSASSSTHSDGPSAAGVKPASPPASRVDTVKSEPPIAVATGTPPVTTQRSVSTKISIMPDSGSSLPAQPNVTPPPTAPRPPAATMPLLVLQQMQQQTALLHQQFLAGQARALQTLEALLSTGATAPVATERPAVTLPASAPALAAVVTPSVPAPITLPLTPPELVAPPSVTAAPPPRRVAAPALSPSPSASVPQPESVRPNPAPATAPVAATAPAAPTPSTPAAPRPSAAAAKLATAILAVVAEKTGYPAEMLQPGMSLDHDLGIDSIKRVEILSALQERIADFPAVQPDQLGELHRLQDVIDLLDRTTSDSPAATSAPSAAPLTPASSPTPTPASTPSAVLATQVLAVVAEKTGYPAEMLQPGMSLDHDLGIDSIKRVEILSALQERLPNFPAVQPDQLGELHRLEDVIKLLDQSVTATAVSAPTAAPVTAAPVAAIATSVASDLTADVLAVIAEKTGYPVEMLQPAMSLDHDLGIDSIKRVEILSALQERFPHLPAVKPEQLGELHRVQDVIQLLQAVPDTTDTPDNHQAASIPVGGPTVAATGSVADPLASTTTEAAAVDPLQALTMGTVGIGAWQPTQPQALPSGELWIVDDEPSGLGSALAECLNARGLTARRVDWNTAQPEHPLAGLILIAPAKGTTSQHLWHALEWVQRARPLLQQATQPGLAPLLATISRLDGRCGLGTTASLADPASGGLAGLLKTARHEFPELSCKALDVDQHWTDIPAQAQAVTTALLSRSPVELGVSPEGFWTVTVNETPTDTLDVTDPTWEAGDIIVISGGARGVTAACAEALAQRGQFHFVLLGRSPVPSNDASWRRWLDEARTEADIKLGILHANPDGLTPRELNQLTQEALADQEIHATVQRLHQLGSSAEYRSVDVRDAVAVSKLLQEIRTNRGPIRGLVHGAGVLRDQLIERKTADQFDQVYGTKVEGFRNLLAAIPTGELQGLALFSSFTARYGRKGQVDYAIANEVLNKWAQRLAHDCPSCRVRAFNWGPWDGGMVTDSLKPLFAREGVALIPLGSGAALFATEMLGHERQLTSVEVVVLAGEHALTPEFSLASSTSAASTPAVISTPPQMPRVAVPEVTPVAPVETTTPVAPSNDTAPVAAASPVVRNEEPAAAEPFAFRTAWQRSVSLAEFPVLGSHVLGGKAVVPVALIVEWFAQAASHQYPGYDFLGFEQLRVLRGLRVGVDDQLAASVDTGKPVNRDGLLIVPVRLLTRVGDLEILHAQADVRLGTHAQQQPPASKVDPFPTPFATKSRLPSLGDVYERMLFHGEALRGMSGVVALDARQIAVTSNSAPAPAAWINQPLRGSWLADPLVLDVALQALIVWCWEQRGKPCLPCAIGEYQQFRKSFPKDGTRIVARVTQATDQMAKADIRFLTNDGELIALMTGCENVLDQGLVAAFQKQHVT